ncbi:MAG TPA: hypothetical protein IGS40_10730 [Trichormus sp. M33_DOE_039]|nr:hypothetical protein [Trichormus sp. M33_DOE_039]
MITRAKKARLYKEQQEYLITTSRNPQKISPGVRKQLNSKFKIVYGKACAYKIQKRLESGTGKQSVNHYSATVTLLYERRTLREASRREDHVRSTVTYNL